MKKSYGIRLGLAASEDVEIFAKNNHMTPTAAAEFFVNFGMEAMKKTVQIDALFARMESQNRAVYQSLVRQGINTQLMQPQDDARLQKAIGFAREATNKIFGEPHE